MVWVGERGVRPVCSWKILNTLDKILKRNRLNWFSNSRSRLAVAVNVSNKFPGEKMSPQCCHSLASQGH